jgi:phosphinothricin acetyltransferase
VVGWGALSRFRSRHAYLHTVDDAVYVSHEMRRVGIGAAILRRLIELGREAGHHVIVSVIVADQEGSLALHRGLGFAESGRLREVGWKFDRWLDVVYMQLTL